MSSSWNNHPTSERFTPGNAPQNTEILYFLPPKPRFRLSWPVFGTSLVPVPTSARAASDHPPLPGEPHRPGASTRTPAAECPHRPSCLTTTPLTTILLFILVPDRISAPPCHRPRKRNPSTRRISEDGGRVPWGSDVEAGGWQAVEDGCKPAALAS